MKSSLRYSILLHSILRIVLVLGLLHVPEVGYAQESTSFQLGVAANQTGVYRDPNNGWLLSYPSDFQAEVLLDNLSSPDDRVIKKRLALYTESGSAFWIDSYSNLDGLDLRTWYGLRVQPLLSSTPSETMIWDAQLNGVSAILAVDNSDNTTTPQIALGAVNGIHAVVITYLVLDSGQSWSDYQMIIESFRWLTDDFRTTEVEHTTQLPSIDENLPQWITVTNCCGINSPGNICVCCTNNTGAQVGNCVWWACHMRRDVPCAGNANTWESCAERAGKSVNQTPAVGALAVWADGYNHIVYVEQVNSDKTQVYISEMSCDSTRACGGNTGYDGVSRRWRSTSGLKFIHGTNSSPPPIAPSCPSSGNVILYKDWNYSCGGEGEGSGYVKRDSTGFQNVPSGFHDRASSIRIASGWSVKLYEHSDRGGGWACRTSSDENFAGDRFHNSVSLNDSISSFEVFRDSRCGEPIPPCPAPSLSEPSHGQVFQNRTVTFRWNSVNCEHNGFTFRVKTTPDMDGGGETVIDTGEGGTSRTVSFDARWDNRDLYWSVRAANAPGGASWSSARHFRISPNQPPTISFNTANGNGDGRITTRDQNWTFQGTAGDPEGQFSRVEFRCNDCDNAGNGQSSSTSTNWSITRNGMSGRNYVYFEAYDDRQGTRSAKTLELNIDLAAPTTSIQINDKSPDGWPTWFNEATQVRLTGRDNGTGRAVADVREVRYRRDGGGEQVQSGSTVNFTESSDGEHTVRYYAVDNVGNVESERSATYRVDRTPPTAINGLQESNGVVSNQWQKNQNKPTFTWNASTDAHSGLGGYQFYFGADANGTAVHFDVAANAARTLTPNNLGVATGTYYLRGRTWDTAANTSPWQTLFVFRYDGTPPPNPGQATHINGPKNDTWQKITAQANFTWTVPVDEGSGIKGYLSYWGTDPNGESANLITSNSLQSATPLCAQGQACTGYLRLRSQDNVGHNAEKWSTTFVLRYDGAPPVADFTVNGGVTQTAQTLMTLDLKATDLGSGLREMRFSSDGTSWTNWERYVDSRVWEIPAISRQSWPIYLQVKDAVGWESAVFSRTIYFDVNVDQPRSDNYRLFNYVQVAGAGAHTSQPTGYQGHSTVGQTHDSPRLASASYSLASGYEAGSRAIPLVVPGHDDFDFINGIFASGVVNGTMQSGQYRLIGVWGEPALPNNRTEIASSNYRLQPGFLAARPSAQGTPTPMATPTPGPTPTPTPTPACEFPRISINDGAVFATGTNVNLNLCAPNVNEMMVSNDGGFAGAVWEPYARSKAWTLTSHSNYVLPRFVYVAFRDAKGQIYATYLDDIILDPTPPDGKVRIGSSLPLDEMVLLSARAAREGSSIFQAQGVTYLWNVEGRLLDEPLPILAASADGSIDLYLSARDQVGNVTAMQVSESGSFGGSWESYSALKPWTPAGGDGIKTVYARFRDEAGNASAPYTATFALDTQPPIGGIALSHPILGPDVVTTTVWLGAEDNLSGVADMRLSTDPTFADAVWRPFAATSTWVYSQNDRSRSALYVQFRDYAGNASEVLNAPLLVDGTPPLVYVEVEEGDTLTRTVRIYSYDELTYPNQMRLTNDPLFLDGVVTQSYSETVIWTFDDRHVVWVQVRDGVGNWSEAWPAYDGYVPTPVTPPNSLFLPSILSSSSPRDAVDIEVEAEANTPTEIDVLSQEWDLFLPAIGD